MSILSRLFSKKTNKQQPKEVEQIGSEIDRPGAYYWTKNPNGIDMLIIEVDDRRWVWGKAVLDSLERIKDCYPDMSIEEATEKERRHWGGWCYCDLTEELEVLKQTPEYKSLEEAYKNRKKN